MEFNLKTLEDILAIADGDAFERLLVELPSALRICRTVYQEKVKDGAVPTAIAFRWTNDGKKDVTIKATVIQVTKIEGVDHENL